MRHIYIYDRQAGQIYTSTFNKRHTSWEKSASSPGEVKIHTHVTELSFDTVPTEDSGKSKYHFYCCSDNMSTILCLVYCDILYCTVLCCVLGTVYLMYLYCVTQSNGLCCEYIMLCMHCTVLCSVLRDIMACICTV